MEMASNSGLDPKGAEGKNYGETKCSICLELMIDPVENKCKHRFCGYCFIKLLAHSSSNPCPVCRCLVKEVIHVPGLKEYIEEKLVPELDEESKKARSAEILIRQNDTELWDHVYKRICQVAVALTNHLLH